MTSLRWTIGKVEIFQIIELTAGELIQGIIKKATAKNTQNISWLSPYFADKAGGLKALVQSFLIRSDNKSILIDTGIGNDKVRTDVPEWANLQTDFLKKLADIGVAEADIDIVTCTHLHMDHVGWNTRLKGNILVPTFPNARYLFVQKEYEYWEQKPDREIVDDKAAFDDSVSPIINARLAKLVEVDYKLDRNIRFIPTPGHTPNHVSVFVESQNQRAVISGDFLHHPCQIAKPEWITAADTFPDKAVATRQKILNQIADTDTLLIGSHFANPVAGRVVRLNGGFVFEV
jgi:glyoxylase-like metal-dependent hydrolase (beta-lactamase superfamily II)